MVMLDSNSIKHLQTKPKEIFKFFQSSVFSLWGLSNTHIFSFHVLLRKKDHTGDWMIILISSESSEQFHENKKCSYTCFYCLFLQIGLWNENIFMKVLEFDFKNKVDISFGKVIRKVKFLLSWSVQQYQRSRVIVLGPC